MGKKLLILICLFSFFKGAFSQGTAGKDFWIAFLDADLYCNSRTPPPALPPGAWDEDTLELYITSQYAATVTVEIDTLSFYKFSKTFILTPNKTYYILVPSQIACRTFFSDFVANNSVHVSSDSLISVQAVSRFWSSKGATTIIPSESIPNSPEYFITTNSSPNRWICNVVASGGKVTKSAEFAIVGISEQSVIEVIPTGISSLNNNKRGIPFEIKLKRGETFQYMTTDDDLTGSIIRSRDASSKFAVFAGNRMTYSDLSDSINFKCTSGGPHYIYLYDPYQDMTFLDHTYEQMYPAITLGNSYTALPFKNNLAGYYLKIMAIENNTRISLEGRFNRVLNQGEFFTLNVGRDSARKITANKRLSVTQFAKGNTCNGHPLPKVTMGDVSQIQLAADHQFITDANINKVTNTKSAWVNSSSNYTQENYLNVLVKEADTSQFKINNITVVNIWKKSTSLKGYRYAHINIDTINYHLTSPKGFIAYVYGYGNYEGYAYVAGASFKPVNNDFIFNRQCRYDTIEFSRIQNDSFLNYSWRFGDNSKLLTGAFVKKIYKDTGWYNVVMYCRNARTNALDSIIKRIYIAVADNRPVLFNDTLICGKFQFTIYSKYFDLSKSYRWYDKSTSYYHQFRQKGLFWVKVKERTGCEFIDTFIIKNYPYPKAKFTTSDSLFCSNGSKEITFTNLSTSVDTVLFQNWDFGDLNINDTNRIVRHTYKKADKYLAILRVRTIHGCDDVATQLIEVLPSPKVNFIISGADSCFNTNGIRFRNNTIIDSATHLRFIWNFGEGTQLFNRNPQNPLKYPLPGKYTARLVYENNNGCADTLKKDITIYSNPLAVFSYLRNGQCIKDSIRFVNRSTSSHLPLKSHWKFGDNKTDTASNPVHLYANKGLYDVSLITETPQGCKDTTTRPLKVLGSPTAKFTINDSMQCLIGNKFVFTNTSVSDTGSINFKEWIYNDGIKILNADTTSRIFGIAGKHTMKLKVRNTFGCSDSLTRTVETKEGLIAKFTANKSSQCFNNHVFTFKHLPVANDSIKGMTWYFNSDSINNSGVINNIQFPSYGKYPVRLKLYSKFGCDGETSLTVNVNPDPVAKINIPMPVQCFQGHAFNFTDQSTIPQGNLSEFKWDFGDMTTSVIKNPPSKTYPVSGSYKIILTVFSDSGCMDTASVIVLLQPSAVIGINPVPAVCLNDSSNFTGNATVTGGIVTDYQWDFGDNTFSGNPSTTHVYKSPGIYSITLRTTSDNNCKDSKTVTNWVTVHALPNAAFKHSLIDGGQNNSIVSFSDLTKPKPVSLLWDFGPMGKSIKPDTALSILDTTTIKARLFVTDTNGCKGMIEKYIFVSSPGKIFMPNAFTANNDGLNDGFGPKGIQYATNYKFTIYNRWGEIVFKSQDLEETWNGTYQGKLCPNGVYIYKLELNDFFGQYKKQDGHVLLLW